MIQLVVLLAPLAASAQKGAGAILQVSLCPDGTEEILLTDQEYGMEVISLKTTRTRKSLQTEVIRAVVEVYENESLVARSKTDAAGKMTFSFLEGGTYSARFTVSPLLTTTGTFVVKPGQRKPQLFTFCISDKPWKHFFDSLRQVNQPYLDSLQKKN